MKNQLLALLALVLFVTPTLAGDANVKAALYEIERAEQQIAGATATQKAKLTRISRLVESADDQLDAADDRGSDWTSARERLDAVIARLGELQAPTPTSDDGGGLSDADLAILGGIDRQTDGLIRQIGEYDAPDFVRLEKQLTTRIEGLKKQYQGLSQPDHPQAVAVAQKVLGVEKEIQDQIAGHAAAEAAIGDVEAELTRIEERLHPGNKTWTGLSAGSVEYSVEAVVAFAEHMHAWRAQAEHDRTMLAEIVKVNSMSRVTSLQHKVDYEFTTIDRSVEQLDTRLANDLRSLDQLVQYSGNVHAAGAAERAAQIRAATGLLEIWSAFDVAMGRSAPDTSDRAATYEAMIAELEQKAADAPARPKPTKNRTPKTISIGEQRIEIYGARLIEITKDGEIWIDGGREGSITTDGEIWVSGTKEGDLTADGEVWKGGVKVGDVTSDGEVWRDGGQVGTIEGDGAIWIGGSKEGWFEGGNPAVAGAVVFYGFFSL